MPFFLSLSLYVVNDMKSKLMSKEIELICFKIGMQKTIYSYRIISDDSLDDCNISAAHKCVSLCLENLRILEQKLAILHDYISKKISKTNRKLKRADIL